ncbi:serine hydrolase FSH [Podospora appendiculata]|uniref:Serine hydrolase FSH n=1 Tax=Podospora appendiculata TaxID=314037 RepID=A0AAE0X069_9PEZI|nr:serine hydrolase FSH [Podospora appendiculata]
MRPKLLFLHGGGTNAEIFRIQSGKLATLLNPQFTLVFADGFHESPPGPGVLPFFDGAGPFRQWMHDYPVMPEVVDWPELDRMAAILETQGPFVGIVGFSQGAKAGMLLLRHLERAGHSDVEFFVSVCGTVPFRGPGEAGEDDERRAMYEQSRAQGKLKTESLHFIGESDPYRAESELLLEEFCEPMSRRVVRFKGAHHMPSEDAVNKQLARMILQSYEGV